MPVRDRIVLPRGFKTRDAEAWVSLVVAADHLTRGAEAICARFDLTAVQFNVLRILRGAEPGGHPRGEVARRCVHRAPDITRLIDRLVRRRLVERVRSPDDGRLSVARITRAGLALLDRMDPAMNELMRESLAPLSAAEKRELARLCDALVP
jgi:DNA-binding MarR family transcriptional regulator